MIPYRRRLRRLETLNKIRCIICLSEHRIPKEQVSLDPYHVYVLWVAKQNKGADSFRPTLIVELGLELGPR